MNGLVIQILILFSLVFAVPAWAFPPRLKPNLYAPVSQPIAADRQRTADEFLEFANSLKKIAFHQKINAENNNGTIARPIAALTPRILNSTLEKIQSGAIQLPNPELWDEKVVFNAFYQSTQIDLQKFKDDHFSGLYEVLLSHAQRILKDTQKGPLSDGDRLALVNAEAAVLSAYALGLTSPDKIWQKVPAEYRYVLSDFRLFRNQASARHGIWQQWPLMNPQSPATDIFLIKVDLDLSVGTVSRYYRFFINQGYSHDEMIDHLSQSLDIPALNQMNPALRRQAIQDTTLPSIYSPDKLFSRMLSRYESSDKSGPAPTEELAADIYAQAFLELQRLIPVAKKKKLDDGPISIDSVRNATTWSLPAESAEPHLRYEDDLFSISPALNTQITPLTSHGFPPSKYIFRSTLLSPFVTGPASIKILKADSDSLNSTSPAEFAEMLRTLLASEIESHRTQNPAEVITNPEAFLTVETIDGLEDWLNENNFIIQLEGALSKSLAAEVFETYFDSTTDESSIFLGQRKLIEDLVARSRNRESSSLSPLEVASVRKAQIRFLSNAAAGLANPALFENDASQISEVPFSKNGKLEEVWRFWYLYEVSDAERFRMHVKHTDLSRIISTIKETFVWEVVPGQSEEEIAERAAKGLGLRKRAVRNHNESDMLEYLSRVIDFEKIPGTKDVRANGQIITRISSEQIKGIFNLILSRPLSSYDQIVPAAQALTWADGRRLHGIPKLTFTYLQSQMSFWLKTMYRTNANIDCAKIIAHLAPAPAVSAPLVRQ